MKPAWMLMESKGLAIPDNFPKKVISLDEISGGSYQGIEHIHLENFLLSI